MMMPLGYMNDGVVIDMVITGLPITLTTKLYYNMLLPLKTKQRCIYILDLYN